MKNFDIYETVTNLIIEKLEEGTIPWQMPWRSSDAIPRNLVSKKPYRGFNFWYLLSLDYERPYFLTFNQVKSLGARVKKGSKSHLVIYWKLLEVKKKDEIEEIPMLRYYRVFNVDDVEGIDPCKIPEDVSYDHDFAAIDSCENLVKAWMDAPVIRHGKKRACYIPAKDEVHMPDATCFYKDEEYYSTLYHELVHSTGHLKRLNRHHRFANLNFGSQDYSQEELVAELGAAYLCGISGIENVTIDNNAAYIKGWLRKLKDDKKLFVSGASMAQHAVDYILKE